VSVVAEEPHSKGLKRTEKKEEKKTLNLFFSVNLKNVEARRTKFQHQINKVFVVRHDCGCIYILMTFLKFQMTTIHGMDEMIA